MKCNDMRLMANELIRKIYMCDYESDEEVLGQLEILFSYTKACIDDIKKKKAEENQILS